MQWLKGIRRHPQKAEASAAADRAAPGTDNVRPFRKPARPTGQDLTTLEREFLPHLLEIEETPPSPTQRKLLWTILALVAVAIAWAYLGKISVVSTAQGKFIPDGRVKQIQPMETSVVKAIHVKEGQHVAKGQLLVELDPTINAAELDNNARQLEINRLDQLRLQAELGNAARVPPSLPVSGSMNRAQPDESGSSSPRPQTASSDPNLLALEENLRRSRLSAYQAKLEQAKASVAEKQSALAATLATERKYEEVTTLAKEREEKARPLLDTGAISRIDYLQLKQELVSNQNDLASQHKLVEQARHAETEAKHQLNEVQHSRNADIYTNLAQKVYDASGLTGSVEKAQLLYALKWLRSPVDGLIQRIDISTVGGVVTPAQNLVTIVPDGTPLIVEATLSNEDVGYVKVGQDVEIKVDTFPFQKYGTLKGKLVWVSPDADENGPADPANQNANGKPSPDPKANRSSYTYKVHVKPEQTTFVVDGKEKPIQAGMTVQADVSTDRRRIIEFFLAPVIKYLDEGLTVR